MNNVYSVSYVNSYIKNMFTQDYMLRSIYVKGEVSNVKYHSSGHIYFTMKDEGGTLACVMFSGNRKGLSFTLTEGQNIIALGQVDIYVRDGKYQLYAKQIVLDGEGDLHARFEALKQKLEDMGMFSAQYKKPIPKYVKTVGIVTAPTGAAIRDIINITKRHNPYVQLILYPAKVQGDGAAYSIAEGIRALDNSDADVIIVGRGGGSIEDLWAFNEETVARAVFDCNTPIISGVGHETDTTICDFVADLRAPTPSAAAELVVYDLHDLDERILGYGKNLKKSFMFILNEKKSRFEKLKLRIMAKSPEGRLREMRMQLASASDKLSERMNASLTDRKNRLVLYSGKLESLSPLKRLKSGYALVESDGKVVGSDSRLLSGDEILIHMISRDINAAVIRVKQVKREEI
ncbi:MAG: exodeoxyribonuclease VII large subunit [Lachnospiraceae bacterium]|nr:exodeoxyribonuclease VII large subunit [Lachnospiraceae bacterium]